MPFDSIIKLKPPVPLMPPRLTKNSLHAGRSDTPFKEQPDIKRSDDSQPLDLSQPSVLPSDSGAATARPHSKSSSDEDTPDLKQVLHTLAKSLKMPRDVCPKV